MKKLLLLLALAITAKAQTTFGQAIKITLPDILPTIKATSNRVDIRVGDDYFLKEGWVLEPNKKPDIFSIGSKWLYDTKKVTFITDIDSISFDVRAGQKYNFIVLLNEKTPCYIQILASANPIFMNIYIITVILFTYLITFIILYQNRKKINSSNLLKLGYIVPILFWLMTIISGYIHENYNHFSNVISELGTIGTKSEIFTSFSLVIIAFLHSLFSVGFYKISKSNNLSIIPAILSFSMPLSMTFASIFPLGNEFHSFTGPLPFLIMVGSSMSFLFWRNSKGLSKLSLFSLLSTIFMLLILSRFVTPFSNEFAGLIQRFFYLGWTIWLMAISYYLPKRI